MLVTIWVTEHPYSQRVGMSLKMGFKDDGLIATPLDISEEKINATDVHIGYGILRGMGDVYRHVEKVGKHWFNIDLGYFDPGHFDGQYRIAYKNTQSLFDAKIQSDKCPEISPWKNGGSVALICPPTKHTAAFFNLEDASWITHAENHAKQLGLIPIIRRKDATEKLDDAFATAGAVITFNSSVAWKALQLGIPAFSDTRHSTVGSWHGMCNSIDALKKLNRESLFRFMYANQLSLVDIQQGKLLPILKRTLG
ncbi:MAG: hypothetical protein SFW65_05620 [Alphaproteobacteria bacterium]|nr:hypothetical protein [Alphaproteobacteria bacterium]